MIIQVVDLPKLMTLHAEHVKTELRNKKVSAERKEIRRLKLEEQKQKYPGASGMILSCHSKFFNCFSNFKLSFIII